MDTFKSRQWRICAHCLGTIKPNDRIAYVHEEVACTDCAQEGTGTPSAMAEFEKDRSNDA